jgi:cytochrome c biogenesis protein CcmG, thiol:disulfide interchange protein DsbE
MRTPVAIIAFLIGINVAVSGQHASIHQGRKAPVFALEDIDGRIIELDSLWGKGPVIIDFWATWCVPCLEELQALQLVYTEYAERGVTVAAISTDNEKTTAKVRPLVRARKFTFPVLRDPNSEVARMYYAQTLPTTVIVDRNGFIVYSHTGYKKGDEQELRKIIDALLAQ